jgi:hypothetical protein
MKRAHSIQQVSLKGKRKKVKGKSKRRWNGARACHWCLYANYDFLKMSLKK